MQIHFPCMHSHSAPDVFLFFNGTLFSVILVFTSWLIVFLYFFSILLLSSWWPSACADVGSTTQWGSKQWANGPSHSHFTARWRMCRLCMVPFLHFSNFLWVVCDTAWKRRLWRRCRAHERKSKPGWYNHSCSAWTPLQACQGICQPAGGWDIENKQEGPSVLPLCFFFPHSF